MDAIYLFCSEERQSGIKISENLVSIKLGKISLLARYENVKTFHLTKIFIV